VLRARKGKLKYIFITEITRKKERVLKRKLRDSILELECGSEKNFKAK
jgi:hypothetical protein